MPDANPIPELLNLGEAARYLGVSRRTVEEMVRVRSLPAINLAVSTTTRKNWRVKKSDLDLFIKARSVRAA